MYKAIIFWLLLFATNAFAQDVKILGAIQMRSGNDFLSDISIYNKRTQKTAFSNVFGRFYIDAQNGDMLVLKGLDIFTEIVQIDEKIIEDKSLIVLLNVDALVLKDVIARRKLSGNLDKDIRSQPYKDDLKTLEENMNLPKPAPNSDFEKNSYPIYSLSKPLSIDVDAIYDILSGNRYRRENLIKWETRELKLQKIIDFFSEKYFVDELGLPKNHIREFVEFCWETSTIQEDYKWNNFYLMSETLKVKSTFYIKNLKESNNLENLSLPENF